MQRAVTILVSAGVVAVTGVGYFAFANPFTPGGDDDNYTAAQVANRAQVARITDSPNEASIILPIEEPPHLDYVQAVRTETYASEIHFQQAGLFAVVCGGVDPDSACDAETATVFREEEVQGKPVRLAWVVSKDTADKDPIIATPAQKSEIESFWKSVDLGPGSFPWLDSFS